MDRMTPTLLIIGLLALATGCFSKTIEAINRVDGGDMDGVGSAGNSTVGKITAGLDHVFAQDHVVQIRIDFDDEDAYEKMLFAAKKLQMERPFYKATFTFDGEELTDVGVRLKGDSSLRQSRDNQMKSFKIHFEEFEDGQRFHHVDRLNLHNNFDDPSIMRERLAYALANQFDIAAPRTAYAEVWVDGHRHGVYTMVQQVDRRFLKEHFGEENDGYRGNLYKCYHNCPLDHRGTNAQSYQQPPHGGPPSTTQNCPDDKCGLVLKTNENEPGLNDYSDVILLTETIKDIIEQRADKGKLDDIFDMNHFVRFQAFNLILSNIDSYSANTSNFYLYRRPTDGRFQMIPWDLNEAFGNSECMTGERRDSIEANVMDPCQKQPVPLMALTLDIQGFQDKYCNALRKFLDDIYIKKELDDEIDRLHDLVNQARSRNSVMDYPPLPFKYAEYLDALSHKPPREQSNRPPGPQQSPIYSLGYFNENRIDDVRAQMTQFCQ